MIEVTQKEIQEAAKWVSKHTCNGAKYSFETKSESGIGISVAIVCIVCAESKDITDYSCW